ncbi:toprim domain-containing protein [Pseudomonas aeruginosa]|nr:toprim domain-containing protein [Pseudomonas aeruginosa]
MTMKNGAHAPRPPLGLEKVEMAFRDALQGVFGRLDWLPVADGAIHRFHVPGDRAGSLNGWYVLFADSATAGAFGSWKTGETHHWSGGGKVSSDGVNQMRERIEQARRQREAEQHQRQLDAAVRAGRAWESSEPAPADHPYLARKRVVPHRLRRQGDVLLVPLYADGYLCNLQRIAADGEKRFLAGGRVKGAYSPIGSLEPGGRLYICEGWATGATIHAETGAAVACAMNAGNLLEVGRQLQRDHPDALLIFAGDDDRQTPGNPGRTAAMAAALAAGALVTFPDWPDDAPPTLSDFNDLARWRLAHE